MRSETLQKETYLRKNYDISTITEQNFEKLQKIEEETPHDKKHKRIKEETCLMGIGTFKIEDNPFYQKKFQYTFGSNGLIDE